jgi:hypothetical protein
MLKDFSRAFMAVGLLAALGAAASAQPTGVPKKDDAAGQLKAYSVRNANPTEVQQILTRYFTPTPTPAKPGVAPAAAKPTILVAVEPKTKTLFVRGPSADVEAAGKIIAQLDSGDSKGPLRVLAVQHVPVEEAMRVLTALDLAKSVVPCPLSHLLILPQDDSSADEVQTVVNRLEAAFKPETKVKLEQKPGTAPK